MRMLDQICKSDHLPTSLDYPSLTALRSASEEEEEGGNSPTNSLSPPPLLSFCVVDSDKRNRRASVTHAISR